MTFGIRYLLPLVAVGHLTLRRAASQEPVARQCSSPAPLHEMVTMWPTQGGASSSPDQILPMATLGRLLAGEYDLALITTEGVETPTVDHWRILLIPVDSAWQKPVDGLTGDWIRYPVAGTRTDLAPRTPADSLRRRRFLATSDIEMSVDLRTGRLQWMTAPGSSHGGDIFDVGEVSDSLLFGRWRHGGIVMVTLKRGDLEVGESWRGYYCAWKIR